MAASFINWLAILHIKVSHETKIPPKDGIFRNLFPFLQHSNPQNETYLHINILKKEISITHPTFQKQNNLIFLTLYPKSPNFPNINQH